MIKIGTYGCLEKGAINYSFWIPENLQRGDYTLPGIQKKGRSSPAEKRVWEG